MRFSLRMLCCAATLALGACATQGTSQIPKTIQANLSQNVLQLAVGTANIGRDGAVGLNVVETLRSPSGTSATLANQPMLTGPAGFLVPAGAIGAYSSAVNVDAGTNHISGSPQVPLNNAGLVNSTLGTFTGAFAYGFGPFNSDQYNAAYYPGNPSYTGGNGFYNSNYVGALGFTSAPTLAMPFFAANTPMVYLNGPPAEPFFANGTFPAGFAGYPTGFSIFELTPIAGTYGLAVNVAAQNASPVTYNATATLADTTVLGAIPQPVFNEDGAGGGSGAVTVPSGVTETMVYIVDTKTKAFFTVGPLAGTGALSYSLPDKLGACSGSGCQSGSQATPSLNSGDAYLVAAVGFDYPAFEAGPPGNTSQSPKIVGSNGQADLTMSPVLQATY